MEYAGDIDVLSAWRLLEQDPRAVLVDVRSQPEWAFVGLPDLTALGRAAVLAQWQTFPGMQANPAFVDDVVAGGVGPDRPVLLLCRSGVRSRHAAIALTGLGYGPCYNIADGFEGPLDSRNHRGLMAGWKAAGLPWQQR